MRRFPPQTLPLFVMAFDACRGPLNSSHPALFSSVSKSNFFPLRGLRAISNPKTPSPFALPQVLSAAALWQDYRKFNTRSFFSPNSRGTSACLSFPLVLVFIPICGPVEIRWVFSWDFPFFRFSFLAFDSFPLWCTHPSFLSFLLLPVFGFSLLCSTFESDFFLHQSSRFPLQNVHFPLNGFPKKLYFCLPRIVFCA